MIEVIGYVTCIAAVTFLFLHLAYAALWNAKCGRLFKDFIEFHYAKHVTGEWGRFKTRDKSN